MEEWDQIFPNATNVLPMDVEESGSDVVCLDFGQQGRWGRGVGVVA